MTDHRWKLAIVIGRIFTGMLCIAGAVVLLAEGKEHGWGWLLVVGFVLACVSWGD